LLGEVHPVFVKNTNYLNLQPEFPPYFTLQEKDVHLAILMGKNLGQEFGL
jgi:hypothetical protein